MPFKRGDIVKHRQEMLIGVVVPPDEGWGPYRGSHPEADIYLIYNLINEFEVIGHVED